MILSDHFPGDRKWILVVLALGVWVDIRFSLIVFFLRLSFEVMSRSPLKVSNPFTTISVYLLYSATVGCSLLHRMSVGVLGAKHSLANSQNPSVLAFRGEQPYTKIDDCYVGIPNAYEVLDGWVCYGEICGHA